MVPPPDPPNGVAGETGSLGEPKTRVLGHLDVSRDVLSPESLVRRAERPVCHAPGSLAGGHRDGSRDDLAPESPVWRAAERLVCHASGSLAGGPRDGSRDGLAPESPVWRATERLVCHALGSLAGTHCAGPGGCGGGGEGRPREATRRQLRRPLRCHDPMKAAECCRQILARRREGCGACHGRRCSWRS